MDRSSNTYNKFKRVLWIDMKDIFGKGFAFPYCKDEIMDRSSNTYNKFKRVLLIDMKDIFGKGFAFPYCKDGIFLVDLSSLNDQTKSSSYVSKCMTLAGIYKRFVMCSTISEALGNLLPRERVLLMGSRSDNSRIAGSDFDLLIILDTIKVMVEMSNFTSHGDCFLADLSYSPPGFTMLRSSIDLSFLPLSGLHQMQTDLYQFKFVKHGPSLQMLTEKGSVRGDKVYAIPCTNWPPGERHRWINKPRPFGWPPKHVIEYLSQTRCVVVPVGREDSEFSYLEWRFAFPFVERGLVLSFNNIQLQCFVLLKNFNRSIIKKIDNVNDDGINTFHIKMVMFWECENSDPKDWCEENLFDCVRRCLRRLRLAIEQKELKHFIIEKRNVLVTKLKNSETREKVLQTIKMIENDISGSFIKCISDENVPLLLGMVEYQYNLKKSQTSLDVDKMLFNRLLWLDTISLLELEGTTLLILLRQVSLSELHAIRKSISSKTDDLLSEIKSDYISISESIPNHTMSSIMRDIYLICNDKVCHKEIKNILLRVSRFIIGTIDVRIGSRLFEEATKIHGVGKKEILSKAEHFFKKGVKMDDLAGQLHLATFYIACDNDESEKILTSMLKQNRVLVCRPDVFTACDAIEIIDGKMKLTLGILHDNSHSGYARNIMFRYDHDLQLVPDVLKYELCMREGTNFFLHPFVYAKYLQILLSLKSKSRLVIPHIQDIRKANMYVRPNSLRSFLYLNILAYCYRQIGFINEAFYLYMSSMKCFPNDANAAMFHLAFLLNQIYKTETKAVKET